MDGRRLLGAGLSALLALAGLGVAAVGPAGAVSEPELVASGLDNPRHLSFGPDGSLYVAEVGRGGEDDCVEFDDEDQTFEICVGDTGAVTRIDPEGQQTRSVTGLASLGADGEAHAGPHDVAVDADDTTYVLMGLGANVSERAEFGSAAATLGTLLRIPAGGDPQVLADLAAWEDENDPDGEQDSDSGPDSNPYGLARTADGFYVADAGGNTLLHVSNAGAITLRAVFPTQDAELPPFMGAPPGTTHPSQSVPTGVIVGPQGEALVSELTGFPFPEDGSRLWRVPAGGTTQDPQQIATGFTAVVDLAADDAGNLYLLELASTGLMQEDTVSRLVQHRTDGTRKVLLQDELIFPGGVAVGPDGMIYVTNCSVCVGDGSVIRVDPTVARDPATQPACPPMEVPGSGLTDLAGEAHAEAIECMAWWGVARGFADGRFGPHRSITRGQIASFLARAIDATDRPLPADAPDAFRDDDGSAHESAINRLAAVGIIQGRADGTVGPDEHVSRAAYASLIVRAHEYVTGESLPAGPDAFDDDNGSAHEPAINKAAAQGWARGTGPRTFDPDGNLRRGQSATFVARVLSSLVQSGDATLPS